MVRLRYEPLLVLLSAARCGTAHMTRTVSMRFDAAGRLVTVHPGTAGCA